MALKIENMYERYVWNEWSRLLGKLAQRSIRKDFYPHKMDELDDMTNNFTMYRREQVNCTKTFEHIFRIEKMICNNSDVIYQEWRKQTSEIDDFINTFPSYIKNNTVEEFVEQLKNLQKIRLESVVSALQIRIEERSKEEAAESLLLLHKKEEKKRSRQLKKEEEKNNPPPLRRSSRILKKNQ